MDVHKYQARELLPGFGVPIQRGSVAYSADQTSFVELQLGRWHWTVKAQIHCGARGEAGGIKLCKTYHEVQEAAKGVLGKKLVTHQTGPQGNIAAAGLSADIGCVINGAALAMATMDSINYAGGERSYLPAVRAPLNRGPRSPRYCAGYLERASPPDQEPA